MAGNGPTTDIEIISNAIVLLGKGAIATINDADEFAVAAQKFYDLIVPSELAQNAWKFAKKQIDLSLVAAFDPDFAEYNSAYDLPADFLSLVRIYPMINYQIVGKRIYCASTGRLQLEYNYNVPVTYWSAPFKEYVVYALASKLALSVTENQKLAMMMAQEREMARANAQFVDAQNSPGRGLVRNPYIECRGTGYTNWGWSGSTGWR